MAISIPYTFVDGEVAEATQVNANFNALTNGALPIDGGTINGDQTITGNLTVGATLTVTNGPSNFDASINVNGVISTPTDIYCANLLATEYGVSYEELSAATYLGFAYNGTLLVYVNGTYVASFAPMTSDARFKRDIGSSGVDALAALRQLETKRFVDQQDRHHQVGLLAQQVRAAIPEAVIEGPDVQGEPALSLDLSVLVSYLVGAVQQLSNRVRQLERRQPASGFAREAANR